MPPFETGEYQGRLTKAKASMAEKGIEVLLITDPGNMNYLSGYDAWSFYVHQVLIVAQDRDQPIWLGRAQDMNCAYATTYLDRDNILGYPDHYVQSTERHTYDFIAAYLAEQGWAKAAVGTEMDNYYYTAACQAAIEAGLPNASFKDATALVGWVRAVKSEREIGYMKEAARIMEIIMRTAIDAVEPGVRQCDAVAEILRAQARGTEAYGGSYTGILPPLLPTGKGTSAPHLTWTDEPFRTGEGTILELGASRHQYHCPMARTVHLGTPPKKLADTAKVVVEGLEAALEEARPGTTAEAVEGAWRAVISRHGIEKASRIGYSTGVNYPPDWGEHTISLRPGDKTVLEPNMTIHCIGGIWEDDWGVEISECFRVTETGSATFCDFPRQLFVKD